MMILRKVELFLSAALAVTLLASCSGFFTNSLASGLARDPDKLVPAVTTDNIDELISQSEGNPDMAAAVLNGIADAMAGASAAEQAELRAAAVNLASTASGVGVAILNDAGTILENLDGADVVSNISDAIGGLSNLGSTASALVTILPSPDDTVAFDAFVAQATADDLAMAAVVLLADKATSDPLGTEAYINQFDSGGTLSPQEALAVKLATSARDKNAAEGGGGTIGDLLSALNL
jgi:hypothetical protein